jgi:exoribonuclease R
LVTRLIALSVEKSSDGTYKVGVHIYDVSYFVKENKSARQIVQQRSRSLYTPLRKLPLWPALFSESVGLLSLGVNRLAILIILHITVILSTVIRSCCTLSYEHA